MKQIVQLIDELKQDINYELIEANNWELRQAYEHILQRLEQIRYLAVTGELQPVANGGNK